MTVRLHDYLPSGNGYKVRLLLAQLGIPYERIEYDITRGETRASEFLENVNANGRVPVLETEEGEFLPESDAILFYLAQGTPFLPGGPSGQGAVKALVERPPPNSDAQTMRLSRRAGACCKSAPRRGTDEREAAPGFCGRLVGQSS